MDLENSTASPGLIKSHAEDLVGGLLREDPLLIQFTFSDSVI